MQIKNSMKSHLTPTSLATIGNSSNSKYFRGYIAIGVRGSSGRVDSWQTIKYYLEIRMTGTPFNIKSFLGMCSPGIMVNKYFYLCAPQFWKSFLCPYNLRLSSKLSIGDFTSNEYLNILTCGLVWKNWIESQHRLKLFFNNLRS